MINLYTKTDKKHCLHTSAKKAAGLLRVVFIAGLLCIGFSRVAWATDYYVSNQGNDQQAGTSVGAPWKTLAHAVEKIPALKPGDKILLHRGSVFYETMAIKRLKGNASLPITIGAYGEGANPIISGAVNVSEWKRVEGNIWKASCPECPASPAAILMNNELLPIGRYPNVNTPNRGYMNIDQSHDYLDQKIVIDHKLSSAFPDNYWQGAEVVTRTRRWLLDRARIRSHRGDSIHLAERLTYGVQQHYGYFIQNHYKTLDINKEWYFNNATQELYVVLNADPNHQKMEVTQLETLLSVASSSYLTIQDITFEKGSVATVQITNSDHCKFQNNEVAYSGRDGVYFENSHDAEISNNNIKHSLNTGLMLLKSDNASIHDNEVSHSATIAGLGASGNQQQSGVYLTGKNGVCEYNTVLQSGYNGIHFGKGHWDIRYNLIDSYCLVKDDGAGIYTYGNKTGSKVSYNIILNGVGSPEGTLYPDSRADRGLYADGGSTKVVYDHNTIYNSGEGMLIHVSNTITLTNNTFLGNASHTLRINQSLDNGTEHPDLRNSLIKNNTFISTQDQDALYRLMSYKGDVKSFGTIGDNLLCQPLQSLSPAASFMLEMTQNPTYPNYGIDRQYHTFSDLVNCVYGTTDRESPLAYDRYIITDSLSKNQMDNSEMDYQLYEVKSWSSESNDDNKFYAGRVEDGGMDGPSLRARFTNALASNTGSILYKNLQFEQGAYYALSFDIKGTNQSQIILRAITKYGEDVHGFRTFMVKPEKEHYRYIFKAETTTSDGRIYFDLKAENDMVWFDNLEMYKVQVQEVQEAQVIRLEYNASKTAREIAIDGAYRTVEGKALASKVILAPYESLVLFKDPNVPVKDETTTPPTQVAKDKFPWDERFVLNEKTIRDQGPTGWQLDTTRAVVRDSYGIQEQQLRFAMSEKPVLWYSNKVDIDGKGKVGISLDIKEKGALEADGDSQDYLYAYYKVDGGALHPIRLQEGNMPADDRWYRHTVANIYGKYLEIIIYAKTTAYQETFYIDNILVDTQANINAHQLKPLPNPPDDQENPSEGPTTGNPDDSDEDDTQGGEPVRNGSTIRIYAAGRSGKETMQLLIDEKPVESWKGIIGNEQARELVQYVYVHNKHITTPESIRVAFAGAEPDDSELLVDKILLDGVIYETEAATTYSTGTNKNGNCAPGYKEDERLHCQGYFQYASGESTVTGLDDEISSEKITLLAYPNPTRQQITVQIIGSDEEKVDIELADITGRILYSIRQVSVHRTHTINVSRFRAGMYVLRVRGTASYAHTTRIVKK